LHWMDACRGLVERSSLDEIQWVSTAFFTQWECLIAHIVA
jgi:hypothetical protein